VAGAPARPESGKPSGRLHARDDDVGAAVGLEVGREVPEETGQYLAAVRASVGREVRPAVAVPLLGPGGEVRRVREDPVEPAEPSGEVGANEVDAKSRGTGGAAERSERGGVEVGRDDRPGPGAGGGQSDEPRTCSDLEDAPAPTGSREPREEFGVLPRRIDGGVPGGLGPPQGG
jgi:hypothetical protein